MSEPFESLYFNWLCAKVLDNDTRQYESLMEILFKTEFTWLVPADQHRESDGLELRQEFLRQNGYNPNRLNGMPCSIFEVLIAFSDRASFQTDLPARNWFWTFIENLGLHRFETITSHNIPFIEDILNTFTWRIYEPNGHGGLFPLNHTNYDQREIEIWYQFCEYVAERQIA